MENGLYNIRAFSSTQRRVSRFLSVLVSSLSLVAALAGPCFAEQLATTGGVPAENGPLLEQIADTSGRLKDADAQLEKLRQESRDLDAHIRQIENNAKIHVLGSEFARALIEARRALPPPERFANMREARAHLLSSTSDARIRSLRALDALGGVGDVAQPGSALATQTTSVGDDPKAKEIDAALATQRDLLSRLADVQQALLERLRAEEILERDLEERTQGARTKLSQMLLWMPVSPGFERITVLEPTRLWMGAEHWREAGEVLRKAWVHQPVGSMALVSLALLLLVFRRRLTRALASSVPVGKAPQRLASSKVARALAITLALALPLPVLLWVVGTLLGFAADTQPFPLALGESLVRVSQLLWALTLFTWIFDRRGIAVRHFGWDESSLAFLARALRRFTALFIPLMLVASLTGLEHAPFEVREGVGRLSFFLVMIVLTAFLVQIFRRQNPLMQYFVAQRAGRWVVQLHAFWFSLLIFIPLAVSVLAVAGYYVAAVYFFGRMVRSMFVVLGVIMVYGLMAMWVKAQGEHLKRMTEEKRVAADPQSSDVALTYALPPDLAMIGAEMRSLLSFVATLFLLGGFLWVWWDAIPALATVGSYELWTYTSTVGGKAVPHALTASGLFMAVLIGVVTAVIVRNVGGVLDILLLRRFDMQADATYATKVVVRYVLVATGAGFALSTLGIAWDDVQWLIAALSVGLGFGLQEIFGNLVAGLIMLAERPVRLGDIVTVGDVTGTVARINARATTIVDFDNKENLIPNKSFITDRITNWTLSNQTTRLVLKISTPRGKDVSHVQQLLFDAVRSTPGVVAELPPAIDFLGFSDKTLDFEINAYVDSFDKRSVVRNQINCAIEIALREPRAMS